MSRRRLPVSSDKRFRKSPCGGDHGTPERWQHSGRTLELTDRAGILAARAMEEHMLDSLALRGVLDPTQAEAGLRFFSDYVAAGLVARVTGSYSGLARAREPFDREPDRSDAQEAAYRRWRGALRAMGRTLAPLLVAVACHEMLPLPREIVGLRQALDVLIRHYGLRR